MSANSFDDFLERTKRAFAKTFEMARLKNELHYAFSLAPEFNPYKYNTAHEAKIAFYQYLDFLNKGDYPELRPRIAMAFYCHLSEASGYWEVIKNMLCVANGEHYNVHPFKKFVAVHKKSGEDILPNANKIIQSLIGLANKLENHELVNVFKEAYDSDIRNGFSHADYVILNKGIALKNRYGKERIILNEEFNEILNKGIFFYKSLMDAVDLSIKMYSKEKKISGSLDGKMYGDWYLHFNEEAQEFHIGNVSYMDENYVKYRKRI